MKTTVAKATSLFLSLAVMLVVSSTLKGADGNGLQFEQVIVCDRE